MIPTRQWEEDLLDGSQTPVNREDDLLDGAWIAVNQDGDLLDGAWIAVCPEEDHLDGAWIPVNQEVNLLDEAWIQVNREESLLERVWSLLVNLASITKEAQRTNINDLSIYLLFEKKHPNTQWSKKTQTCIQNYFELYNEHLRPLDQRTFPEVWNVLSRLLGVNSLDDLFILYSIKLK